MATWEDLRQPAAEAAKPETDETRRYNELCAAVFSTGLGAELLEAMRTRTIDKRTHPRSSEAELREDEAVRRYVASLEESRDRGLKSAAPRKPTGG